jgi:hypothetical protein
VCIDIAALKDLSGLASDFEFDIQREAGFIASPRILDLALRRPEVAELELVRRLGKDAARHIGRRIHVEVPAAGVLRISCSGERSFETASLINTVAATYVDQLSDEALHLRAERIALLERGLRDAGNRLAEKRAAINRLETLLAESGTSIASDDEATEPKATDVWVRELDALRIAMAQGEDMRARISAELAQLRIEPHRTAVELRSPARM